MRVFTSLKRDFPGSWFHGYLRDDSNHVSFSFVVGNLTFSNHDSDSLQTARSNHISKGGAKSIWAWPLFIRVIRLAPCAICDIRVPRVSLVEVKNLGSSPKELPNFRRF
jgi:hypothetical protein